MAAAYKESEIVMDAFKKLVNQGKDIVSDARKHDVDALEEDAKEVREEVNQVNEALTDTAGEQDAKASGAAKPASDQGTGSHGA